MWENLSGRLSDALGRPFVIRRQAPISGGDINRALRLDARDGTRIFVKLGSVDRVGLFAAEAAALEALAAVEGGPRLPTPILHGRFGDQSAIALEWLDLESGTAVQWHALGARLANLHRNSLSSAGFGWHHDNWIGSTVQPNAWADDWVDFWRHRRIGHQLELARGDAHIAPLIDPMLDAIPRLLEGRDPRPSLCHGDLWRGNVGITRDGDPVIFDPAAFYGDREVDLAMTELFGRLPDAFYAGYQATWPVSPGYARRRDLYNLYHLLNHRALFGGGYGRQAAQVMARLIQRT